MVIVMFPFVKLHIINKYDNYCHDYVIVILFKIFCMNQGFNIKILMKKNELYFNLNY